MRLSFCNDRFGRRCVRGIEDLVAMHYVVWGIAKSPVEIAAATDGPYAEDAALHREALLEALSNHDDELFEAVCEGESVSEVPQELDTAGYDYQPCCACALWFVVQK